MLSPVSWFLQGWCPWGCVPIPVPQKAVAAAGRDTKQPFPWDWEWDVPTQVSATMLIREWLAPLNLGLVREWTLLSWECFVFCPPRSLVWRCLAESACQCYGWGMRFKAALIGLSSWERDLTDEIAGSLCFPDGNAWAWLRSGIILLSRTKRVVSLVIWSLEIVAWRTSWEGVWWGGEKCILNP